MPITIFSSVFCQNNQSACSSQKQDVYKLFYTVICNDLQKEAEKEKNPSLLDPIKGIPNTALYFIDSCEAVPTPLKARKKDTPSNCLSEAKSAKNDL